MPPLLKSGYSYYDNEAEFTRAFDAYQGGGAPYPVFSPETVRAGTPTAGPQGQRSTELLLGRPEQRGGEQVYTPTANTQAGSRFTSTPAQARGQEALMAGARTGRFTTTPSAARLADPTGARQGAAAGGVTPAAARPFWQNYDDEELMALSPGALAALPPEAFATMPNDIFVKYPQLLSKLQPQDVEKRDFGLDFQQANRIGQYALRPDEVQPSGAPTYPGLQRTGIVPPRVQAGLSPLARGGGYGSTGTSPYRVDYSKAQIRRPSAQSFYGGMNPTDREATLATFEGVGLNPQDVESDIQGPSRGGRRFFGIGEAPRRPQVRY